MERKFKAGDKVWDKLNHRILIFESHYENNDTAVKVNGVSVYCRLSDLEPYDNQDQRSPCERKYKKGEKVWHRSTNEVCEFIQYDIPDFKAGTHEARIKRKDYPEWSTYLTNIEPYDNQDNADPRYKEGDEVWHITEKRKYLFYCYTYVSDNCKLTIGAQTYTRSLSDIEPYSNQDVPDPKYKSGDKVWRKESQSIWEFVCYQGSNEVTIKKSNTFIFLTLLETDIEPYAGQDKPSLDRIKELVKEMQSEPMRIVPAYPFTVILKSGVRIGVDDSCVHFIKSNNRFSPLKITYDNLEFSMSEIAAIVPTENLML